MTRKRHKQNRSRLAFLAVVAVLSSVFGIMVPGFTQAQVLRGGAVVPLSVTATGVPIPGQYVDPVGISGNGQRAMMFAMEGNPWPNGGARWFAKDLSTGELRHISKRNNGTPSPFTSGYQAYGESANLMSADGRYYAYASYDWQIDMAHPALGSGLHSFVYDWNTDQSLLVETNSAGQRHGADRRSLDG